MPTTSSPSFSQLRAFVALCDHQHFGEAATALGVSQPSLSQAITALEKRVGGELVERTTRRVLVTSLGEALLPFARDAVLAAEAFNEAASSQGAALTGTMRLGLIPTLAPYMAPVILDGLPAELPDLHPELREMVTGDILDMLGQGRLDAAVIAIDVDDDKLAPMLDYGATAVVNSVTQNAREEVFRLTGGKGVDVSFEALGIPATWTTALDVLSDGGRMVPIGLGAGVQTAGVEINRTVRRSQSILGSYGARTRQDLPAVVDLADKGVINYRDVVSRRLPLEEAGAGYTALRNREIQGRAVVDMSL